MGTTRKLPNSRCRRRKSTAKASLYSTLVVLLLFALGVDYTTAASKRIRLLVLSDIHDDMQHLQKLVDLKTSSAQAQHDAYDYVVLLGDFCKVNHVDLNLKNEQQDDATSSMRMPNKKVTTTEAYRKAAETPASSAGDFEKCDEFTEKVLQQAGKLVRSEHSHGAPPGGGPDRAGGDFDGARTKKASAADELSHRPQEHHPRVLFIGGNHDRRDKHKINLGHEDLVAGQEVLGRTEDVAAAAAVDDVVISKNITNQMLVLRPAASEFSPADPHQDEVEDGAEEDSDLLAVAALGGTGVGGFLTRTTSSGGSMMFLESEAAYLERGFEDQWPTPYPYVSDDHYGEKLEDLLLPRKMNDQRSRGGSARDNGHHLQGRGLNAIVSAEEGQHHTSTCPNLKDELDHVGAPGGSSCSSDPPLLGRDEPMEPQLLLFTHTGPHVSATTVFPVNRTHLIHAGSMAQTRALRRYYDEREQKLQRVRETTSPMSREELRPQKIPILANVHGHVHPGQGMDSVAFGADHLKVLNPGPLYLGHYLELVVAKKKQDPEGGYKVVQTARTANKNRPFQEVWHLEQVNFRKISL